MPATFDLKKIEKLVATATSPKQKKMYQDLLDRALKQQQEQEAAEPPPEPKPQPSFTKAKPTSTPPPKPEPESEPEREEIAQEKKETKKKKKRRKKKKDEQVYPNPDCMFQALGVIRAQVNFEEEKKATVTINGKQYWLGIAPRKNKVYEKLHHYVSKSSNKEVRLAVYPRVRHFASPEQEPLWSFSLLGFQKEGEEPQGILAELEDFEFKLNGTWHFIENCKMPCISIYRNYTSVRGERIKESEPIERIQFAKGTHLPINWRKAPVKPARYNPKVKKRKYRRFARFVQVKARFLPEKGRFKFICQTAPPTMNVPRHLRLTKEDRTAVKAAMEPDCTAAVPSRSDHHQALS